MAMQISMAKQMNSKERNQTEIRKALNFFTN